MRRVLLLLVVVVFSARTAHATPFSLVAATDVTVSTLSLASSAYLGWIVAPTVPVDLGPAGVVPTLAPDAAVQLTSDNPALTVASYFLVYPGALPIAVGHAAGPNASPGNPTLAVLAAVFGGPADAPSVYGAQWVVGFSAPLNYVGVANVAVNARIGADHALYALVVHLSPVDLNAMQINSAALVSSAPCDVECQFGLPPGVPIATPEPASLALLGTGMVGFALRRRQLLSLH